MWTAEEKYAPAVVSQYRTMQDIQTGVLVAVDSLWAEVDPAAISPSWAALLPVAVSALEEAQWKAAAAGADYVADSLAQQGRYTPPSAFADPDGFAGRTSLGAPLEAMLYVPAITTKTAIGRGMTASQALELGRNQLRRQAQTTVVDTGRAAGGVDVAARPGAGFTRMLNPPSCGRCAVLAGRFYRWNAGFLRHPRCDCIHQPTYSEAAAAAEGLMADPYEYFNSLSPAEQDRWFGAANAQSIRDGADLYQVVNAQRGMSYAGISADGTRRGQRALGTTSEGTSRRGNAARLSGSTGGRRLTPEEIYRRSTSREQALELLRENGYVLPGGQVPGGSIRGDVEGFGALGRGGSRAGVRAQVLEARRTGVRDPRVRATMTEAERRRFDAELAWEAVVQGRNPFGSGPLSPQVAAAVEKDYRHVVLRGEQQWKLTGRAAARD